MISLFAYLFIYLFISNPNILKSLKDPEYIDARHPEILKIKVNI